jgi:hypothetical protein
MNRRIIILILLAGLFAGCAQSPLQPSITVTSGSGTLSVHGTGFDPARRPPLGPTGARPPPAPCAYVSLVGMPQPPYPSDRAMGQGHCDMNGTFDLEWAYSFVGHNCSANQQVSATVFAIDTHGTNAGASQTITMPWGANCVLASQSGTSPISYWLELPPGSFESGSLGNVQFSNADIELFFEGDTSDVIPFKYGVRGYVILVGTAAVVIHDSSGKLLGVGTFLPKAGIFVSVDNVNGGVGFGSFGVPPWDPSFPGQVAFPMALQIDPAPDYQYDLKSAISVSGGAISCIGFPGRQPDSALPCLEGDLLPTTAGLLSLHSISTWPKASFKARKY